MQGRCCARGQGPAMKRKCRPDLTWPINKTRLSSLFRLWLDDASPDDPARVFELVCAKPRALCGRNQTGAAHGHISRIHLCGHHQRSKRRPHHLRNRGLCVLSGRFRGRIRGHHPEPLCPPEARSGRLHLQGVPARVPPGFS